MNAESVFFLICCTILTCVNLLIFLHTFSRRRVKRDLDTLSRYVTAMAKHDPRAAEKAIEALAELYYELGIKPEELDHMASERKERYNGATETTN